MCQSHNATNPVKGCSCRHREVVPTSSRGFETQAQRKTAHNLNLRTSWQRTFQIKVSQASTPACYLSIVLDPNIYSSRFQNQPKILIATENLTNIKAKFWVSRVLGKVQSRVEIYTPEKLTSRVSQKGAISKGEWSSNHYFCRGHISFRGRVYSLIKVTRYTLIHLDILIVATCNLDFKCYLWSLKELTKKKVLLRNFPSMTGKISPTSPCESHMSPKKMKHPSGHQMSL